MGEAKRRKAEIQKLKGELDEWKAALSPSELRAATIAEVAHRRIVQERGLVGGCYLLAFFLHRYLQKQGIETQLIVGWVHDGETDAMTSHAWVELGGKKIDISLTRTEFPDAQPPGPLLILDRVMRRGEVIYSYHIEQSAASMAMMMKARESDPDIAEMIQQKMFEHTRMSATAKSEQLIDAYFNTAPKDRSYESLARLLDGNF
jgi:hypothetical protein